ncbi:hypothetical protein [Streptomyces sp. NPDC048196]|uniref:hypothetical protein n=1 Tax=Streptomyces sp. NPDC048196 TaxID=3154712 RepID=UPI0033D5EF80
MSYQPTGQPNVPFQPPPGGFPQQGPPLSGYAPQPFAPPPPPKRNTGKIVGFIALGICFLLLGGGGAVFLFSSKGSTPIKGVSPTQPVYEALNKALANKDEDAFLKPFQGDALKTQQRKVFRNLVKVPFKTARFERVARTAGGEVEGVSFVHQIKGVDVAPVYEEYAFTFTKDAAGAQVVTDVKGADHPFPDTSGAFYPAPWDVYDDMAVEQLGRVVVISDKAHAADTQRFTPYIAKAADDDVAAWDRSSAGESMVSKGALVVLEPKRDVYSRFYREGEENDALEAGANLVLPRHGADSEDKTQFGGSRIVMDSSLSRFTSRDWRRGVKQISRHEIGHAMVAPYNSARGALPVEVDTWVSEGFAGYMESRDNPAQTQADNRSTLQGYLMDYATTPESDRDSFYAQDANERHQNYVLARLAIRYMAEKYGEKGTFNFVTAEYRDPGYHSQKAHFQQYLGVDRSTFMEKWRAFVRKEVPGVRGEG